MRIIDFFDPPCTNNCRPCKPCTEEDRLRCRIGLGCPDKIALATKFVINSWNKIKQVLSIGL